MFTFFLKKLSTFLIKYCIILVYERHKYLNKSEFVLSLENRRIFMDKQTTGIVITTTKQWWIKINRKPVRVHILDGADFPYIIKVEYIVNGKKYKKESGLTLETLFQR